MTADPSPGDDRRVRLKARTRASIVAAAAALMDEAHGLDFTVDALAQRADVSRRTVFNHFASLDDVVAAVLADALHGIVDSLAEEPPRAADPHAAMAADVVAALRAADLVATISSLTRGLGLQGDACVVAGPLDDLVPDVPAHQAMILLRSLAEVSEELATQLDRRHPEVDRLDVDLTVGSLMSNLVVLYRYWLAETGGQADRSARETWARLLERSLTLHS
ncbi:TetR family transcriptional regulator [Cellulosimicrobium arenosum]|uniref:TetR/AcrR family transcriptional regulator n=1 Tax=Cellulosimicrobium arenosum TaxID=2708133 RepID=A0A927PEU5_9MICO|nr:TetR/AcrR family transcriptional regulator [Cellulosimicrobium arenosum]